MEDAIQEKSSPSDHMDECCNIAESIIQEIQIIELMESRLDEPIRDRRPKGSMKKKLMKQIKLLKEI